MADYYTRKSPSRTEATTMLCTFARWLGTRIWPVYIGVEVWVNTQQLQTSHFMDKGFSWRLFWKFSGHGGWSPIVSTGVCETFIFSCPFVFSPTKLFFFSTSWSRHDSRIFKRVVNFEYPEFPSTRLCRHSRPPRLSLTGSRPPDSRDMSFLKRDQTTRACFSGACTFEVPSRSYNRPTRNKQHAGEQHESAIHGAAPPK